MSRKIVSITKAVGSVYVLNFGVPNLVIPSKKGNEKVFSIPSQSLLKKSKQLHRSFWLYPLGGYFGRLKIKANQST